MKLKLVPLKNDELLAKRYIVVTPIEVDIPAPRRHPVQQSLPKTPFRTSTI